MTDFSLTILIPCLNEELGIGGVVKEYCEVFPSAQVLVVDNGSEDRTAELAHLAGAEVISEPRRGKARAIATALCHIDSDLVLMVDGDGSYPVEGAKLLLEEYKKHPSDMITGIRCAQIGGEVFRPMHQMGMSLFARAMKTGFGYKPLDLFSGLRLFSRRFYQHVPVLSSGFELEIELTIQAIDKNFSWKEIPVPFRSRAEGSSSKLKTVRDGIRILKALIVLFRDYRPLAFFGTLSLLGFGLALAAGALPIYEYFTTSLVGRLPLAILAASIVIVSTIVFLAGLLLESSLRHHREAYHIQLRKLGAPKAHREFSSLLKVVSR